MVRSTRHSSLILAIPAIVTALAFCGLFRDKAFAIDDSYFLLEARHVLTDPWHPSAFDIAWGGGYGRASQLSPTGPLMSYLLVPTVLADGAEWAAHLTVTAFLCWAAYSMVQMCLLLNFSRGEAPVAALMLVTTPAVIAMASTSMPDVPALALSLAAAERWLAFQADGRWHQGLTSFALMALAVLTRSHAAGLIGVCALTLAWPVVGQEATRPGGLSRLWPLAAVPFAVLLMAWVTRDPQAGTTNLAQTWAFLRFDRLGRNVVAYFAHFVFAIPLALPWLVMRWRQVIRFRLLAAAAAAGVLLWPNLSLWWAAGLAGLGATVVLDILSDSWRRHDGLRVFLGLWLLIPLPVCLYVHMPSKYLVLSAPAAVLVLILESRRYSRETRIAGSVLWVVCAGGLGALIIFADARRADLGRRAARELIAAAPADAPVWYGGHWGFQWYAEQAGARSLLNPLFRPRAGDFAVTSRAGRSQLGRVRRQHLKSLLDSTPGGRVMSNGAGFYSNDWGYLPWSWGRGEIDRFDLWKLLEDVEP